MHTVFYILKWNDWNYVTAKKQQRNLTEIFCKKILEINVSVIDLLEGDLPKACEEEWVNVQPSFSSTMRKHLVIRKEQKQENTEDSKRFHKTILIWVCLQLFCSLNNIKLITDWTIKN